MERYCRWKWNGQVYWFDITKPEHMTRLILGLTALKGSLATRPQNTDADLELSVHSEILRHFFDIVLGEGVGEELCGRSCSSAYALAYLDFMQCVSAQFEWMESLVDAAEQQYRKLGAALGWVTAMGKAR